MDLLFYAAHHTSNQTLIDIATKHSHTVRQSIIRDKHSTFHCVNIDPETDKIKFQQTVQGYKDWFTWSRSDPLQHNKYKLINQHRGQAWGILGYTQTYGWTKDPAFLDIARGLADYFVGQLAKATHTHPFIPLWDFDAPVEKAVVPPRDTSAGMVAANGLLLLHQALGDDSPYLGHALRIVRETINMSYAKDTVSLTADSGRTSVQPQTGKWESVLMNATINNNEYSTDQSNNTGLVYADYYLLEFGNRLLEMGFV